MLSSQIKDRLKSVFTEEQTQALLEVISISYNDLVKVNDFNELKGIVKELAIAQKETQEELKQTQKELRELARQVGGLSMTVGYNLEDKLYPYLERFVEKVYKLKVQEIILRKNLIYENGKFDEINIYIKGLLENEVVYTLGECKAQTSKRDIQRFVNVLERFELITGSQVFPFFVSYSFHPEVEEYLKKEHPEIKYYKTYEIEFGRY